MKPDPRNRELGRIHILKKDLGLDEDTYRVVLWTVARVESSKDLDSHGRRKVIEHLEAHAKRKAQPYRGRPHNADTSDRGEMRKIEALLTDAGKPWAYAAAMAKRMFKKERLEFCGVGELAAIIAALHKQALKRLGGELAAVFGEHWPLAAQHYAMMLFGLPSTHSVEADAQAMSEVLRWWRGELQAVCTYPVNLDRPKCCACCYERAKAQAPR